MAAPSRQRGHRRCAVGGRYLRASAVFACAVRPGRRWPRLLIGLLGGIWGLRLARTCGGGSALSRGRSLPRAARTLGCDAAASGSALFQFQALLIALFCVPFIVAAGNPPVQPAWLAAASCIWCRERRRRVARRSAAGALSCRSRQSRPHLRRGSVALLAPPELFLRVAALVQPTSAFALGCTHAGLVTRRARRDVRVPALGQRHAVYRGPGAAHAAATTTATTSARTSMLISLAAAAAAIDPAED